MTAARKKLWICIALVAAIFAVYGQVHGFDFVNYDDPDYVTENPHVTQGLSGESIQWAFTSTFGANWFPLTWLSHMLDVQLFGLNSGLHHLTNVALHALSTVLLFLLFVRMTKDVWRSAFVAFVFGLHPLHVESVAWVAERKDVLSGLFWMLALWAYVIYAEKPGAARYALVLLALVAGLMSKPMAVTLPAVLLLLDIWPLERGAYLEKLPLFGLSIAAAAITFLIQQRGGAVSAVDHLPVLLRIANAAVSCVAYLAQFVWPAGLAVFYPYPSELPVWQIAGACIVLAAISFAVARSRSLAIGWLWYLVTLLPVIGLVQVGLQARADRYTYIPMIGIAMLLAWSAARWNARVLAIAAGVFCAGWLGTTWYTVGYWRNSTTLFEHALRVTRDNYVAQNNLGAALRHEGRIQEAIPHFAQALRIRPQFGGASGNLGESLLKTGRTEEAGPLLENAVRLDPNSAEARVNLGTLLLKQNQADQAVQQYRESIRLEPRNAEAHSGLGAALTEQNKLNEALPELQEAIRMKPDYADAHYNLGRLEGLSGHPDRAAAEFSEALKLQPGNAETHYNLGSALAAQNQMDAALEQFRTAVKLNPDYIAAHFNLGSALATLGRYDEAIVEFTEVLRLQPGFAEARQALEQCRQLRGQRN